MNQMNNWWSEIEILKQTIAEQQEQIQKAYIRIKELNEYITRESLERKLLGLTIPENKPVDSTPYSHNRELDNAGMYD